MFPLKKNDNSLWNYQQLKHIMKNLNMNNKQKQKVSNNITKTYNGKPKYKY